MSFNAPAYSAAMLAGGTMLSNYLGRRARGTAPLRVLPVSKSADQQQQLVQLRRLVARNTPQTSNFYNSGSYTSPATSGTQGFDIPITANFVASADFDAQVIGDKFYNVSNMLRLQFSTEYRQVRIITYWSKKAGNTTGIGGYQEILDPAAFQVLTDISLYPSKNGGFNPVIRNNLKKKLTVYNKSSDVLENGDFKCRILFENPTAAATTVFWTNRLFIQNK